MLLFVLSFSNGWKLKRKIGQSNAHGELLCIRLLLTKICCDFHVYLFWNCVYHRICLFVSLVVDSFIFLLLISLILWVWFISDELLRILRRNRKLVTSKFVNYWLDLRRFGFKHFCLWLVIIRNSNRKIVIFCCCRHYRHTNETRTKSQAGNGFAQTRESVSLTHR